LEFINLLGESGIPFAIIFTKTDKLSHSRLNENIAVYKNTLLENWEELPPIFLSSSEHKQGKEEVLNYIEQINRSLDE
jgi:GTP-binding protein